MLELLFATLDLLRAPESQNNNQLPVDGRMDLGCLTGGFYKDGKGFYGE